MLPSFRNLALAAFALIASARAETRDFDVVVYGGTSGGVIAAVQAARMGKTVVLISPTAHLGGLTSSGLGWTDLGRDSILGGLSREFYHRLYLHYQNNAAWNWQTRASYGNAGQGGPAFNSATEIASVFEPRVAEAIFEQLVAEHAVPLVIGRLDLAHGLVMNGRRIGALRLEDGREYRGRMFIDTSYEGDLLPQAGATFRVGREPNSLCNETLNGIQTARASGNQLPNGIDPYLVRGNPASGLLPGIEADAGGADGSGDDRLQAYCYRMVLTNLPANRIPVAQPAGYDERDYELLFRAIEAGQTTDFFKTSAVPNRKTDSNNAGGISTDYIGKNHGPGWDWTTLDHDQRDVLAMAHERWQRGLVWTLQNHPRVPAAIRNAYAAWGLPADEFADNDHWPYQLYVREARRLVSDYVMTQRNCTGALVAPDSVGLAAYAMDSHNVRRIVRNGVVKNEGDIQTGVANPYPVSYRAIVPRAGECENLLVPWSLSASHIAFGSIRMEPVFMILGQSAATAACLALDDGVSLQALPYPRLRAQLLADDQRLNLEATSNPASEVIVDNASASGVTVSGTWLVSSSVTGAQGGDYLHDNNTGKGAASYVRFTPALSAAADYEVYLRWTEYGNRATNVPVTIHHANGTATTTVNQRANGNQWILLGTYPFAAGTNGGVTVGTENTDGYVVADAVRFAVPNVLPTVTLWATDAQAREPAGASSAAHPARVIIARSGLTTAPLTVRLTIGGTAQDGVDYPALAKAITIPAGAASTSFALTPLADALVEGAETVTVSLTDDAAYTKDELATANLTLHDRPLDDWKHARFTSAQLADTSQSGEFADPDRDGLPNLLEYALDREPLSTGPAPAAAGLGAGGSLSLTFLRARAELTYTVESSTDLTVWTAVAINPGVIGENVTVSAPVPADTSRRFLRLRVAQ